MGENDRRTRLEGLYAAHAGRVLRYAGRRTDGASAADVLSEVFVVAWQRLDDVPADPVPWLLECARRVLLHQRRAHLRRLRLVERLAAHTAADSFAFDLPDQSLGRALAALTERDREALLLTAWEGLTTEQAARVLGCSAPTFRVRAHRARRRLAAALNTSNCEDAPTLTMEVCDE